ncbi:MAG: DUF938 domain-containing protein [Prochloron sp. SP5CPC1]|nr:DUF938 domain-containing protein [Candidatus Paraprochloron terpiosi SP5CPC1]
MNIPQDGRQYAPATQRNREHILEVLLRVLPEQGNILEIASGTGEHAVFFATHLRNSQWLPSDPNPLCRQSIEAWRANFPYNNLYPPINIDAREKIWKIEPNIPIHSIVNINMIHIAPWTAFLGLLAGANSILPAGGILYLYGPYKQGENTAYSNLAFDQSLRRQNPDWGVRELDLVVEEAKIAGFQLREIVPMPANNLSLLFQL